MDQIDIPVEEKRLPPKSKVSPGVDLYIDDLRDPWTEKSLESLIRELRRLVSPVKTREEEFSIRLDLTAFTMAASRDGRYIYFGHRRMDTAITRVDLATGRQDVVIRSLIPGYRDAWAVTGGGIYFLTEAMGKPIIAFHDLASGANRKIACFPGSLPMIATSGFSVSPDGRTLLVVRADPASASIQTAAFAPPDEDEAASAPPGW